MAGFIGPDGNLFAERILEHGFFPENLPPVFAIENLHEASIAALGSEKYITSKKPTEAVRYNASKRNGQRRIFSTPNPIYSIDAAKFFITYADEIDEHFSISRGSCSIPKFSEISRALKIDSYAEFYMKRRSAFATSRYIVKTDISRFYHSLYTHCIPWAILGKENAKKDRSPESETNFGNRLDQLVRQSQDGQTVGIPVGPDSSRIVSEIVAVSIDRRFRSKSGESIPYLRLVDDIYIGADSLDEAHSHLSSVRESIRYFELDINESKTFVLDASKDVEPFWPVEIRRSLERFKGTTGNGSDFIHTLDNLISISNQKDDDGIIKYAIRKIDDLKLWDHYWKELEPFLVRCCISFPHCLDYASQVVVWRHLTGNVDEAKWASVIDKCLKQNLKHGNDAEVTWALWLASNLSVAISNDIFNLIFEKCGPFPSVLALDLYQNGQNSALKLPKELIIEKLGASPMMRDHWILSYEADRQDVLKLKTKNIQGNDFFKHLYDDNVSFFNRDMGLYEDSDDIAHLPAIMKKWSYEDFDEDADNDTDLLF